MAGPVFRVIERLAAHDAVPGRMRRLVHRRLGLDVGDVGIRSGCRFSGPHVVIGDGTWIHHGVFIDAEHAIVRIGESVGIGPEAMLLTSSHDVGPPSRRGGPTRYLPVTVEDGCWIGARAIILPGVRVGAGCVIAAGAVVVADCAPNGLYGGVPARRIRELDSVVTSAQQDEGLGP